MKNATVSFVAEQLVEALVENGTFDDAVKLLSENPSRFDDCHSIRWGSCEDDRVRQMTGIVFSDLVNRQIKRYASEIDDEVKNIIRKSGKK